MVISNQTRELWNSFNHSTDDIELRVNRSPRWSNTTKLVVALTLVTILAFLLVRFREFVGPLLVSFILAYLLYPVSEFLSKRLHISWKIASILLFFLMLVIVGGMLTLSGFAIVDQIQNLINFLQTQIQDLPKTISQITANPINLGFYTINLADFDINSLTNQLMGMIQPILTNTANIVTQIAGGAATFVAWLFFIILIAYFILAEFGGVRERLIGLTLPGYQEDFRRLGQELGQIWNAFFRGQMIIFIITFLIYTPVLGALGVHYYYVIALLAGIARFVPYIGAWMTWIVAALVMLFQGTTIFGLTPVGYVVLVIAIGLVIDFFMDNFLVPLLMGGALNVHPAAVMVGALVSASLFGLIGVFLAAPVLATGKLIINYTMLKLVDQDPWDLLASTSISNREQSPLAKRIRYYGRKTVKFFDDRLISKIPADFFLLRGWRAFARWVSNRILPVQTAKGDQPSKNSDPDL